MGISRSGASKLEVSSKLWDCLDSDACLGSDASTPVEGAAECPLGN